MPYIYPNSPSEIGENNRLKRKHSNRDSSQESEYSSSEKRLKETLNSGSLSLYPEPVLDEKIQNLVQSSHFQQINSSNKYLSHDANSISPGRYGCGPELLPHSFQANCSNGGIPYSIRFHVEQTLTEFGRELEEAYSMKNIDEMEDVDKINKFISLLEDFIYNVQADYPYFRERDIIPDLLKKYTPTIFSLPTRFFYK